MKKEIPVTLEDGEEKSFPFVANGATAIFYRSTFNEDLIIAMNALNDLDTAKTNTLVILKLAYIMNYQAEHDGAAFDASMDDFISWAAKLDGMSVYDQSGEIVGLYRGQKDTESKPKNQAAPRTAK